METAEKSLNVARDCQEILHSGTNDEKIEMMYSLGLHLTINNKLVRYDWPEPYKTIVEASNMLKQSITKFEPEERIATKGQMYNFDSQNPLWGDRRDSNPQRPAPQAGALPLCYGHQLCLLYRTIGQFGKKIQSYLPKNKLNNTRGFV